MTIPAHVKGREWRLRTVLAIAGLVLVLAHPVEVEAQHAQPWEDAQRLLGECSAAPGSFEEADCAGYLEGVKDILSYLRERRVSNIQLPCTPPVMTIGQLEAVISTFIRNNPQFYDHPAAPVVYAALISAFPCQ